MTDAEIKEIHQLREKFVLAKNTGDHKHISTAEMKQIAARLHDAATLLVMFPQCDSTRVWCIHEANALDSIVRARERL